MEREIQELTGFKPTGKNSKKNQIVLTHTSRTLRDYISSLKYRYNGKNEKLPHFVISKEGEIFQLIPTRSYSKFCKNVKTNKNTIIICLENLGWLEKKPLEKDYINWIGNIYNNKVYERRWRDHIFWEPYTIKQMEALGELTHHLCDEFDIPKISIGHNVKVDHIENFKGVVTLSNYDTTRTDLNPSFDFELFKKLIEDEQTV